MRSIGLALFCGVLAAHLLGCATGDPIPRYAVNSDEESIKLLRQRMASLHQVTGKGTVILTRTDGRMARLDTVFVIAPPDRARIRAWAFSQAVFDLTVTPSGIWLFSPREPDQVGDISSAASNVADSVRRWMACLSGDVPGAVASSDATSITLESPDDQGTLRTLVDRRTLTVRSYTLIDRSGAERFSLRLSDYRLFGEAVWPTHIQATSSKGAVLIETRELQPNVAAPGAFAPPARARPLP